MTIPRCLFKLAQVSRSKEVKSEKPGYKTIDFCQPVGGVAKIIVRRNITVLRFIIENGR